MTSPRRPAPHRGVRVTDRSLPWGSGSRPLQWADHAESTLQNPGHVHVGLLFGRGHPTLQTCCQYVRDKVMFHRPTGSSSSVLGVRALTPRSQGPPAQEMTLTTDCWLGLWVTGSRGGLISAGPLLHGLAGHPRHLSSALHLCPT